MLGKPGQMAFVLPIIILVKQVRKFGTNFWIIKIPGPCVRCTLSPLPLYRITDISAVFPCTKASLYPIQR